MDLTTLVLAIWAGMGVHGPSARAVAEAISRAVQDDAAAGYADTPLEAAALAVYAALESGVDEHPRPASWDARAGRSCGVWQEDCRYVAGASLYEQARWWLDSAHRAGLGSVDSSPARAWRRLQRAMAEVR